MDFLSVVTQADLDAVKKLKPYSSQAATMRVAITTTLAEEPRVSHQSEFKHVSPRYLSVDIRYGACF